MVGIKGAAARVRKPEPKESYVTHMLGCLVRFDAEVRAGIEPSRYDLADMPVVVMFIRR